MEPITYVLSHIKTGTIRHDNDDNDDINSAEAQLYTDGSLWLVVIKVRPLMGEFNTYRAVDEVRHQAVMNACMRANKDHCGYDVYQIYEALGIEVHPDGSVPEV